MSTLEDEKAKVEEVEAAEKTPEQHSTTDSLKAQDESSEPRPHITFKTKMAILVLFTFHSVIPGKFECC
jgi:hypothetical protein